MIYFLEKHKKKLHSGKRLQYNDTPFRISGSGAETVILIKTAMGLQGVDQNSERNRVLWSCGPIDKRGYGRVY